MISIIANNSYFEHGDFLMMAVKNDLVIFHKELGCLNVVPNTRENVSFYMKMINKAMKNIDVLFDSFETAKNLFKNGS